MELFIASLQLATCHAPSEIFYILHSSFTFILTPFQANTVCRQLLNKVDYSYRSRLTSLMRCHARYSLTDLAG